MRIERVVAHRDRTQPLARVPGDDVLRPVRQEQPDPITLLHPQAGEHRGEPFDVGQQLADTSDVLAEERRSRCSSGNPAAASWSIRNSDISGIGSRVFGTSAGHLWNHGRCVGHAPHHSSTGRRPQLGAVAAARRMPGRNERDTRRLRRNTRDGRSAACSCAACGWSRPTSDPPGAVPDRRGGSLVVRRAPRSPYGRAGRRHRRRPAPRVHGRGRRLGIWLAVAAHHGAPARLVRSASWSAATTAVSPGRASWPRSAPGSPTGTGTCRSSSTRRRPTGELIAHMEADVEGGRGRPAPDPVRHRRALPDPVRDRLAVRDGPVPRGDRRGAVPDARADEPQLRPPHGGTGAAGPGADRRGLRRSPTRASTAP